ncbi:hypothetical protein [Jeotgalibacillus soli]|uniref:Uncharacterized protein n=1 Tax=Jeotgalibacillus soli TaxID=889306 RepID=A0A0C2VW87_9BACL|nr:hypothetical protein [Jeotgalibacillus soli]KIL48248.1 hypothetical protein KP78_16950 [Jeotgalibacillus soli]
MILWIIKDILSFATVPLSESQTASGQSIQQIKIESSSIDLNVIEGEQSDVIAAFSGTVCENDQKRYEIQLKKKQWDTRN